MNVLTNMVATKILEEMKEYVVFDAKSLQISLTGKARCLPRAKSASRSLRRALLMPQVNTGSLYRCVESLNH